MMRILVFFPFFLMRLNNILIVTLMKSPVSENLKYIQNEMPVEHFVYSDYGEQNVLPNIGRFLSSFCSVKEKSHIQLQLAFNVLCKKRSHRIKEIESSIQSKNMSS